MGSSPTVPTILTGCSLKVRRLLRGQEQVGALPTILTILLSANNGRDSRDLHRAAVEAEEARPCGASADGELI